MIKKTVSIRDDPAEIAAHSSCDEYLFKKESFQRETGTSPGSIPFSPTGKLTNGEIDEEGFLGSRRVSDHCADHSKR
ncbi:hypothetical protein [Bradyrhizobium sp. RDM4]|uniref:hypothetical protein n=1 Tax=Bradyrhizobium sp. RDM4 TaxID=3378765 RepID=UPI0038FD2E7D